MNAKMMKAALSYLEEQNLYSIDDMITKIDAVTMDDIKKLQTLCLTKIIIHSQY